MVVGVVVGVVVGKVVSRCGRAVAAGRAAALPLGMLNLRVLLRALHLVVVLLAWDAAISPTATAPAGRSAASLTNLPAWSRALYLVLPDGRDAGGACCCCAGFFAPATTKGRWYGTIARCVCALACRIRMAVGGLADLCALRPSAAQSTSTAPSWAYRSSG